MEDKDIEKMYYTIGEAAAILDVNTSLVRFWEKEFDILKPKRNKKGNRLFTVKDMENLKLIYHLVKERGFTLRRCPEKTPPKQRRHCPECRGGRKAQNDPSGTDGY